MSQEHYFSQQPDSAAKPHQVSFEVDGIPFQAKSESGTFSVQKLDRGTEILLRSFEAFPSDGNVLDIGCGWGPISLAVAKLRPNAVVWALDVNQRSLRLTAENAQSHGLSNIRAVQAGDIPEDLTFSGIWSNPPIRVGKQVLHSLMQTWIPRLEPGACAMLVVQKQLGAESFEKWLASEFPKMQVDRPDQDKGYRVIRVTNAATNQ
jgi:16S rRNA G1207 methylase RsmC